MFIELPKVNLPKVPAKEPLHDWLEFLKNAVTWRNVPRAVTNPAVREATRMARIDSLSPTESQAMTARQLFRADQRNMRRHALEEGMRKGMEKGIQTGIQTGRQEGIQQGIEKGMERAALDIASVMLKRGVTAEEVAETTGLPMSMIAKLAGTKTSRRTARRVRKP